MLKKIYLFKHFFEGFVEDKIPTKKSLLKVLPNKYS